ncbi:hypothetical protein ABK040_001753 [Willaertia magna]
MSVFKSGSWIGSYNINEKQSHLTLVLNFNNGKIQGNGTCDTLGYVGVTGRFTNSSPYETELLIESFKFSTTLEFKGYRESQFKGVFGTWKAKKDGNTTINLTGGNFSIKPDANNDGKQTDDWSKDYAKLKKKKALTEMGFEESLVEKAIEKCLTQEEALEWLMNHVEDNNNNETQTTRSTNNNNDDSKLKEEDIQQLMDLGVDRDQVIEALKCCNYNVELAANMLF